MNLINDLDTEIAFAVLFEKRHTGKIKSQDILPLIGRLNKVLKQISEEISEENDINPNDNLLSKIAVH